jgi:hypothetical protein
VEAVAAFDFVTAAVEAGVVVRETEGSFEAVGVEPSFVVVMGAPV